MRAGEEQNEFALRTMLRDFYNRKMLPVLVLTWAWFAVALTVAVYCAVKYFHAGDPKELILYGVIFLACVQVVALLKVFAYGVINRNAVIRRIDGLERRVAELAEKVDR